MKLNMEQRRIVELEPSGHMMIKGVAGSGKTTVAIRRVSFLHHHYCMEDDDRILLVTFNKTLLNYINYQYQKFAEEEQHGQLQLWMKPNHEVEITTIDRLMYRFFMKYQERVQKKYSISSRQDEIQTMTKAMHILKESYPSNKIFNSKNNHFLLDEVEWMNACNITDMETYQNVDRIGRASGKSGTPHKLLKNSEVRTIIFKLMELFNELLEQKGLVTFKKMNQLALMEAQHMKHEKYTHIIIDESQDLTKVQLEFLKCIFSEKTYSSITFVADNTQSIYSHSWLGKGRPYTSIGYDMSGKSRILTKNYRTTTEISTAAYSLIEHDENIKSNVDFVKPSLIDRHGHEPIYRFFETSEKQLQFLVEEIRELQSEYAYSDICIVAKEKRLLESAYVGLEEAQLPCEILSAKDPDFESNKVKLLTMHSIKGLEFKVIFLIDLNEGVIPKGLLHDIDDEEMLETEERKLLYVGMTRANHLLYMSSVQKPSKFIREINHDFLRMKRDCLLRPFHSIGIQNYQLRNQIPDLNAKEEVVRQWFIKELNEMYGYPLELMQLEYPVQQFSRKGYVDLAVNIYVEGKPVPYIFVEVKRFGAGIDEAISQLKSYMQTETTVQYGIVTDGLEVRCFDDKFDMLTDLPKCLPQFLPDTKEEKIYMNLRNGKKYAYIGYADGDEHVEISDLEKELYVEYDSKIEVPLIGDVAAGVPIEATAQYEEKLILPSEWVVSEKDTFALVVTGDSMMNAGIDKGDIVIVNRQNTASNGDIVIAIIGQEATMKKFMPMGDSILLISENHHYEPIQMKREDIIINGIVIGVMKQ